MYENHTDGRLIAELSDQELLEVIQGISGRMGQAVTLINSAPSQATQSVIGILNPNHSPKALREKAIVSFKFLDESFSNYIMEALLRGLEVSQYVQKAYGRSSAIANQYSFALPSK